MAELQPIGIYTVGLTLVEYERFKIPVGERETAPEKLAHLLRNTAALIDRSSTRIAELPRKDAPYTEFISVPLSSEQFQNIELAAERVLPRAEALNNGDVLLRQFTTFALHCSHIAIPVDVVAWPVAEAA